MSENPRMKNWLKEYEDNHYANKSNHLPKLKMSNKSDNHLYNIQADTVNFVHYYNDKTFTYVGFWRRLFAYFIDSVILSILLAILNIENPIIGLFISSLYFAILTSSSLKGSIGKLAIGAIVVDFNGRQISFLNALGRFYASLLSAILFLIGYIMIAFHGQKKSLHDIISGTIVINK